MWPVGLRYLWPILPSAADLDAPGTGRTALRCSFLRSSILVAEALGVDLLDTAPSQGGQLLDNRPVHKDAQPAAAGGSVLQRAAEHHNACGSVRNCIHSGSERHPRPGPGRFEQGHILDAHGDAGQGVGALTADPVHGRLHSVGEELRLAGPRWR